MCENLSKLEVSSMSMRRCHKYWIPVLFVWLCATSHAGVTRIEIESRQPFADGREFDNVGPYERLTGRAYFAIDPGDPANARIVDLELAPRNGAGLVEFSTDLEILAPVHVDKASGLLFYDVNNRGRRMCLNLFNKNADEFLMRQGAIVVWSGWIAEVLPLEDPNSPGDRLLRMDAPVATNGGRSITGLVRAEVMVDSLPSQSADRFPISNRAWVGSYWPTESELAAATLTRRLVESGPRELVPREDWRLEITPFHEPHQKNCLPKVELVLEGGIQPGVIHELIYNARDPVVQGLGLTGIRDLVSFLKHDKTNQNPLRRSDGNHAIDRAIGFGISQSGRCLRTLLYEGLNADEQGRIVFEGLIPHVSGAGLGFFNHRFAQPTRYASQHSEHLFPCDLFPFAYESQWDPISQRSDGILNRARESDTVPKIFHVQNSSEYWHRSGSLVHTDPLGQRDASIPTEVRLYSIGGAQHGAGDDRPDNQSDGQLPENPTDYRPILRALLLALDAWIHKGSEPPPSVYPHIADGTLVDWRETTSGWNSLPGVEYPKVIQEAERLDFGPEFLSHGRITNHPPKREKAYRVLVPVYDARNNERGMLLPPSVSAPVATYTGWNLRSESVGAKTELLRLKGGYIPLRKTREERLAASDPRQSLLERYDDFEAYLSAFEAAAQELVDRRYLLAEDLPLLLSRAQMNKALFAP